MIVFLAMILLNWKAITRSISVIKMENNLKKREPMLVGEIIAQAVMEGRLLKSLTKDVKENE